jgi:hypothetical protein
MRLLAIAVALVACLLCLEAGLFLAGLAGSWLHAHRLAPWFVPACNVLVFGCVGIACLQRKKIVTEEERLTPIVRRDPKTGLRLL